VEVSAHLKVTKLGLDCRGENHENRVTKQPSQDSNWLLPSTSRMSLPNRLILAELEGKIIRVILLYAS
jgi:hypothetical protein